jgi:hypothetical protein
MPSNLSRSFIRSFSLAAAVLVPCATLRGGELHDILTRSQENQRRFENVRCVIEQTYGTVKKPEDAEEGPIFNAIDRVKNELLPEEKWTAATASSIQLWIKRGDVERFEEERFNGAATLKVDLPPKWSVPFASRRWLCNSEKGLAIGASTKGGGNGGMWEADGQQYPYVTPFDFLEAGGGGRGLNLPAIVKLVDQGKVHATIEHPRSHSGDPLVRVFFQAEEQDQIATWEYDFNPTHGMLPEEIRMVHSTSEKSWESRYIIRHKEVAGVGWFPISCISVGRGEKAPGELRSVTRSRVVTSSFERPQDDELRIEVPGRTTLHLSANFKTQFKLQEQQIVDIRGVDDLIHRAKLKELGVE